MLILQTFGEGFLSGFFPVEIDFRTSGEVVETQNDAFIFFQRRQFNRPAEVGNAAPVPGFPVRFRIRERLMKIAGNQLPAPAGIVKFHREPAFPPPGVVLRIAGRIFDLFQFPPAGDRNVAQNSPVYIAVRKIRLKPFRRDVC